MIVLRLLCRTAMFDADKKFTGFQHTSYLVNIPNDVLLVNIGNIRLNYQVVGASAETINSAPRLRLHLAATYFATDDFSRSVANTLHKTHVIHSIPRVHNNIDLAIPEIYGSEIDNIEDDSPENPAPSN